MIPSALQGAQRTWSRGARSATWSTARSSVVLMCTPANILSIFDRRSATCGSEGRPYTEREGRPSTVK